MVVMKTTDGKIKIDVSHIAHLANLSISSEQTEKFKEQLSSILEYFGKLKNVDTTGVELTSQVTGLTNVFRDDVVEKSLSQEEALSNAKEKYEGYFMVDAVLEE